MTEVHPHLEYVHLAYQSFLLLFVPVQLRNFVLSPNPVLVAREEPLDLLFDCLAATVIPVFEVEPHSENNTQEGDGVSEWLHDVPAQPIDEEDSVAEGEYVKGTYSSHRHFEHIVPFLDNCIKLSDLFSEIVNLLVYLQFVYLEIP